MGGFFEPMTTLNLAVFVLTLYVLGSACLAPTPPMWPRFLCAKHGRVDTNSLLLTLIAEFNELLDV